MRILHLSGGLGNQIMGYIFKRYREIYSGEQVLIDDSYFNISSKYNGFELDKIFPNIKLNMLKDNLDKEAWDDILNLCVESNDQVRVPDIFLANGIDICIISDEKNSKYNFDGDLFEIHPEQLFDKPIGFVSFNSGAKVTEDTENICFMGHWNIDKFGLNIKKQIQKELAFPPLFKKENIDYKDDILSQKHSVGIHIRRGDFVQLNLNDSIEALAKSIRKVRFNLIKQNLSPAFFIFSDDLSWCKDNIDKLKLGSDDYIVFIEGNDVAWHNYIDLHLMTFCDSLISNKHSSFALAAKLISDKDISLHFTQNN